MGEFFDKSPDRKNVTFEATDGGLDRSHESLGATFNTKDTVDDCAMHCGDWNWLQRQVQCPRSCSTFCSCLLARVELLANDLQE